MVGKEGCSKTTTKYPNSYYDKLKNPFDIKKNEPFVASSLSGGTA